MKNKRSIFKTLFIPLFIIMILQAVLFYVAAVYGGIEETMNQNAADILTERLINRKNEIETMFTRNWTNLSGCETQMDLLYGEYTHTYGEKPLTQAKEIQYKFLAEASDALIKALRNNEVNGIYLILNDQKQQKDFTAGSEEKIGVCLRDLDQTSNYTDMGDLLLERAPSSVIETLGCTLDSWWEARYTFSSKEEGDYYYYPLEAAWENKEAGSQDLAYLSGAHQISESDAEVMSYSIPLMDEDGYPYAVLGIELTTKYLASLLPSKELDDADKSCYILALENEQTGECTPIAYSGATYSRCFGASENISTEDKAKQGGFCVTGRDQTVLYGDHANLEIYNNNNPFEDVQLTLLAMTEQKELFSYMNHIRHTLATVSLFSLLLGLCGLLLVSRMFSKPITALAKRVQAMPPQDGFKLGRLGILEIDQLVDSIEELNRNASRNTARTEFFSRMSHDMRTPMNAIISFSSKELLEDTTEEQKLEYLEKIHSSGEYLLGLINEVLDMTKIESQKIDLQYEKTNAMHLWDTILPVIEKLAQKKNIRFIPDITVQETMVLADAQHLTQVVMNLLSNAVKFTPEGGKVCLQVRMEEEPEQPEKRQCYITVSDNGIGMSEEFMQRLYRPFEQENEGKEGTGLGLSIAQKLITLMNGTIECSSIKGKGTTFVLKFPLQICEEQEMISAAERTEETEDNAQKKEQSEKSALAGKRILVCEDHPLNTQIIKKVLERVGIEVVTAENGQLGVEKFETSQLGYFDAVLMDIRMPVMDGLMAARTIRSRKRPDAKVIPIIAMTANAFSEDVAASREAGMNAHLSKPVEPQKVYDTLQELLCDKNINK